MASSGFFSDSVIHSVLKDSKLLSAFYHFNNKYIRSTTFPPFIKYVKLPIGAFLKQLCFSTVLTEQSHIAILVRKKKFISAVSRRIHNALYFYSFNFSRTHQYHHWFARTFTSQKSDFWLQPCWGFCWILGSFKGKNYCNDDQKFIILLSS